MCVFFFVSLSLWRVLFKILPKLDPHWNQPTNRSTTTKIEPKYLSMAKFFTTFYNNHNINNNQNQHQQQSGPPKSGKMIQNCVSKFKTNKSKPLLNSLTPSPSWGTVITLCRFQYRRRSEGAVRHHREATTRSFTTTCNNNNNSTTTITSSSSTRPKCPARSRATTWTCAAPAEARRAIRPATGATFRCHRWPIIRGGK